MSRKQIRWIALALGLTVLALAGIAQAEVAQKGTIRVKFDGQLTPNKLPAAAPAGQGLGRRQDLPDQPQSSGPADDPPADRDQQVRRPRLRGLPVCDYDEIQPATTSDALAVCRKSLVGEGRFTANVPESGRSRSPPTASSTPSTARSKESPRSSPTSTA